MKQLVQALTFAMIVAWLSACGRPSPLFGQEIDQKCPIYFDPEISWCAEWSEDSCCTFLVSKQVYLHWGEERPAGPNHCWCEKEEPIYPPGSWECVQNRCKKDGK